jgi:uracil-DNA glycosylase family 4
MICEYKSFSKSARLDDLSLSVQHCNLCPRLYKKRKVLSAANGSIDSRVLFIAEAPGRLGADKTGVPLQGDRTGENFETLLGNVGWKRAEIFITNAVLCNPQDDDGTNGKPTADEIANCSVYLEMVIALVHPDVIVTLGVTALVALTLIAPHGLVLRQAVAKLVPWGGRWLFPLYHPGPRAMVHRSMAKQQSDFMTLAKIVHPVKGMYTRIKQGPVKKEPSEWFPAPLTSLQQAACTLLELGGRMTYFKLTKLLYLADLTAIERLGRMVAADVYLRQVDGPWPPKLDKKLREMNGFEIRRFHSRGIPMVDRGPSPQSLSDLDEDTIGVLIEVFEKYGHMSNSEIKTTVYRTAPMKYILRVEREGRDMRNKAVLYHNRTIADIDNLKPPT